MNWLDMVSDVNTVKGGDEPIYVRLINRFKESIQSGALPVSTKLPTNRELAGLLKVDRSTVSRAYAELAQEGLIESHVGRGTFVKDVPTSAAKKAAEIGQKIDWSAKFSRGSSLTAELFGLLPQSAGDEEDHISFAGGSPPSDSIPHEDLKEVLGELLNQPGANEMFDYSPAEGDALLRRQIKAHLAGLGISVLDEELLILSGSQQGIELVASALVDAGDRVVIEEPTYFWAMCNFRARQAKFLPVGLDDDGMIVDLVEPLCARYSPKLIYTIPDFQNPTGLSLSPSRRTRLIEIANYYGVPIFEDRSAGELSYEARTLPPLRSLPRAQNIVIHQGTLSKALCPGLRIGWLVAPPEVIARLRMAKRASDLSTNSIAQVVLANYLAQGRYEIHLARIKKLYRQRRDAMLKSLDKYFAKGVVNDADTTKSTRRITWRNPAGGLFIWAKLPDGLSARELLAYAERRGVSFSPGNLYFSDREHVEYFRLCFIQNDEATIELGIKRLAEAAAQLFEKYGINRNSARPAQGRVQQSTHV
jgi:2-aminoadipate transaminase